MSDNSKWQNKTIGQTRNPRQKIRSMGKLSKKYHRPRGAIFKRVGWDKNHEPIMEWCDADSVEVVRNSGASLFSAVPVALKNKPKKKS